MKHPLDIGRAWLPHPDFSFHGGPADGRNLTVDLIETDRGMIPPDIWRVCVPPKAALKIGGSGPCMASAEIHEYRFVAAHGSINVGHYEWIRR